MSQTSSSKEHYHETDEFLSKQGLCIYRAYDILHSSAFVFGLKYVLLVLLQVVCVLLFLCIIYVVIVFPTDLNSLREMMGDGDPSATINITINIKAVSEFLIGIKIILVIISLPVLGCALLLGRNRRLITRMRNAFLEVEMMKNQYEAALPGRV